MRIAAARKWIAISVARVAASAGNKTTGTTDKPSTATANAVQTPRVRLVYRSIRPSTPQPASPETVVPAMTRPSVIWPARNGVTTR
jgi:hypothetical protein